MGPSSRPGAFAPAPLGAPAVPATNPNQTARPAGALNRTGPRSFHAPDPFDDPRWAHVVDEPVDALDYDAFDADGNPIAEGERGAP